jgi:hypothetical protein
MLVVIPRYQTPTLFSLLTNATLTIMYRKKEAITLIFTARRNVCRSSPFGPALTSFNTWTTLKLAFYQVKRKSEGSFTKFAFS